MDRLLVLRAAKVSIWTDAAGWDSAGQGLAGRVRRRAVTGVGPDTPDSITRLASGRRFTDPVRLAAGGANDAVTAYRTLAVESARGPAAALREVHRRSNGCDGLVEVACPPDTVSDASAMAAFGEEATRRAGMPNLVVRVPSTSQGRLALQALTARGVNVSSSDVLSSERAEAVAEAHLRGLERRVNERLPIDGMLSMAWVPIAELHSRLDAQLPMQSPLRGNVAVAVAHGVYEALCRRYSGPRWRRLLRHGAHPQRVAFSDLIPRDASRPPLTYARPLCLPGSVLSLPVEALDLLARDAAVGVAEVDETVIGWTLREATAAGARLRSTAGQLETSAARRSRAEYDAVLRLLDAQLRGAHRQLDEVGWASGG